jgi:vacuolar-type H+-ATPase subunit E/Vma4
MKPLGSVAAVIAAIREDAAADVEELEKNAQAEIDRIRSLSTHDVVTLPDRERRMSAARRQAQARLAQEDWEDTRQIMSDREAWLTRAVTLGQQHLAEDDDAQGRRDRIARLAREALSRLPTCACEIVVREEDLALLGPKWQRALASTTSREHLRVVAGQLDGGCIVRTADGRASFDNSYAGRARRLESEWRSALAELFERAITVSTLEFESRRAPHE